MRKRGICLLVFVLTLVVSWLLLSYLVFPISLAAAPWDYFVSTMGYMALYKGSISLCMAVITCGLTRSILEQRQERRREKPAAQKTAR